MIKHLFLSLFLVTISLNSFSQSDTIVVWFDASEYPTYSFPITTKGTRPYRITASGKTHGFIDSIRVGKRAIGYDTIQYHLIVYTADTMKILQGDFYGTYSNGMIIEYDNWGRIIFEGENKYGLLNKRNETPYSYGVGKNRTYTYKNHKSTKPKSIREVIYQEDSKKYVSRLYGKDGELITESKGKR